MQKFIMTRDVNGYNGFGLPFSDIKYSAAITAGVEQTLTVPESQNPNYKNVLAIFSFEPGASVFVSLNETAASPISASFTQSSSELNPAARLVKPGDVIHFVSSAGLTLCGVIFYAAP